MGLLTTCIGAYPKPGYVKLPDWFNIPAGPDTANPTKGWAQALKAMGPDAEQILARATEEAVRDQVDAGVDIPTDGEIRRENYIHYHCRHIDGISFTQLTRKLLRNGAYSANLPTVVAPVKARDEFLVHDWKVAASFTDKPVKITMPGPMTIADTTADTYYHDRRETRRRSRRCVEHGSPHPGCVRVPVHTDRRAGIRTQTPGGPGVWFREPGTGVPRLSNRGGAHGPYVLRLPGSAR